jgi:HlyD family secretion protein
MDTALLLKKKRRNKIMIFTLAGLLVCGTGVYAYESMTATQNAPLMQFATVKRGDVTQTVSASGTVQAPTQISLDFAGTSNPTIASVNVKVGDHVKKGQVLATVDDSSAKLQIQNTQASLAAAQAKLAQVQQGATPQDIAVQQANVAKAKAALDAANNNYDVQKSNLQVDKAKTTLTTAQTNYNSQKALYDAGAVSKNDLDQAQSALDQAQSDYNSAVVALNQTKSQTTSNLTQLRASYNSAVAQLNQTEAPPQASDVASAGAQVDQMRTQLEQQQIDLNKLTIKAPMDGVISQVNGTVGQVPKSPVIMMDNSTSNNLEIMAQVSQTDIGKVKQGAQATFTSSAFENKQFTGSVEMVYPDATTQSGVTTYQVLLSVDNTDQLLKPGMTMNVSIAVGTHQNVLYIPAAALKDQNGKDGVYLTDSTNSNSNMNSAPTNNNSSNSNRRSGRSSQFGNAKFHFQPVVIGLFSSDRVEITSGLKEGDRVVVAMENPNSSTSNSSNNRKGSSGIPGMGGGFGSGGFGGGGFGGGGRGGRG